MTHEKCIPIEEEKKTSKNIDYEKARRGIIS